MSTNLEESKAEREPAPNGNDGHASKTWEKALGRAGHVIEDRAKPLMSGASRALQKPAVAAAVAGGIFVAAAGMWGVTEAVLGTLLAIAVYRGVRRRGPRQHQEEDPQQKQKGEVSTS